MRGTAAQRADPELAPFRVIAGAAYHFDFQAAMAVSGDGLFMTNSEGDSVTELNTSTGVLVSVLSGLHQVSLATGARGTRPWRQGDRWSLTPRNMGGVAISVLPVRSVSAFDLRPKA
jgi:hypothetical protein